MKYVSFILLLLVLAVSCVPAKKYNELLEKEKQCAEELKQFKTSALDSEAKLKTAEDRLATMNKERTQLKADTTQLGKDLRNMRVEYAKMQRIAESVEKQMENIQNRDARELARMQADLEAKILETQRKEDELLKLERELQTKENQLKEREARVHELEEMIAQKDQAVKALKEKIAQALRGFTDKGLSVEERNGKIYVSLEAKLLFASGSTKVEPEGRNAIIELAKAIEGDESLEIIVEGHTDTDALKSSTHPRNNWELSVLRATSVIGIMTENTDISPTILMAAGRSEFHPVDANDKAKNRRIEVIIAPNLDELFSLISKEQ